MALVKGTENYKKAQNLAGMIEQSAHETQINIRYSGTYAEWAVSDVLKMSGIFAVEIAKTIKASYEKYHKYYISSKQAWILACALVENGITY